MFLLNKIRTYFFALTLLAMPVVMFAQPADDYDTVYATITGFLNDIIVFLMLVATVLFLVGVVRYITAGDDEAKVTAGRNMIVFGIIALAVMIAVWAFVNLVLTFIFTAVDTDNEPVIPEGMSRESGTLRGG